MFVDVQSGGDIGTRATEIYPIKAAYFFTQLSIMLYVNLWAYAAES